MKYNKYAFAIMLILIVILTSGLSFADQERDKYKRKYKVTITNLTRGQVFSPPIVIGHDRNFSLFTLGEAASDELAALAEGGATQPLVDQVYGLYPYAVAGGPIMPGDSESVILEISKRNRSKLISVAGMLVTTNDAFFAVRDIWFLGKGNLIVEAPAYDAGSEKNTEECKDIPGPPCGEPNEHPADEAEGYVHVHAGIYGIAPIEEEEDPRLVPAENNWDNPVAQITIRRIYY
jgi:hypothetical protein